ncbi:MAG: cytochrome c [Bacteroidota bacterium]|nr:cytochrome c [Bacteroidota bacterium]
MKKNDSFQKLLLVISVLVFAIPVSLFSQTAERVIPANAISMVNPLKDSMQLLPEAKTIYKTSCRPCHGENGKGDGPSAYTLETNPADHSSGKVQNKTDGELFWLITNGHTQTPMVSFKRNITVRERWELILYIRSLAKKSEIK